jgi:hypothetical protein
MHHEVYLAPAPFNGCHDGNATLRRADVGREEMFFGEPVRTMTGYCKDIDSLRLQCLNDGLADALGASGNQRPAAFDLFDGH